MGKSFRGNKRQASTLSCLFSAACKCTRDKYTESHSFQSSFRYSFRSSFLLLSSPDILLSLTYIRSNSYLISSFSTGTPSVSPRLEVITFLEMVKITILVLAIAAVAHGGLLHKDGPMPAYQFDRRWANTTTSCSTTAMATSYIATSTSSYGTWWQGTPISCIPATWFTPSCTTSSAY